MRRHLLVLSAALVTVIAAPAVAAQAASPASSHPSSAASSSGAEHQLSRAGSVPALVPGFGTKGKLRLDVAARSNWGNAVVRSGKRLYVGGVVGWDNKYAWSSLTALRLDGSRLRSFGRNGTVLLKKGYNGIADLAALPDGKILAAGFQDGRTVVRRFRPDGRLDRSYGTGGTATIKVGRALVGGDPHLALDGGGRAFVTYDVTTTNGGLVGYLVRLTRNGAVDTSFRHGGVQLQAGHSARPMALTVDPSGRPLVALMTYWKQNRTGAVQLRRFTTSGAASASSAWQVQPGPAGTTATGLDVDVQGRVTLGLTGVTNAAIGVVRLNDDFTPDATYGAGTGIFKGRCVTGCGVGSLLTPQGELFYGALLAANQQSFDRAYLARVSTDGAGLDPSFGSHGEWFRSLWRGSEDTRDAALVGHHLYTVGSVQAPRRAGGQDIWLAEYTVS